MWIDKENRKRRARALCHQFLVSLITSANVSSVPSLAKGLWRLSHNHFLLLTWRNEKLNRWLEGEGVWWKSQPVSFALWLTSGGRGDFLDDQPTPTSGEPKCHHTVLEHGQGLVLLRMTWSLAGEASLPLYKGCLMWTPVGRERHTQAFSGLLAATLYSPRCHWLIPSEAFTLETSPRPDSSLS